MDLGVTMSPEVFEEKLEQAEDPRHEVATWNTRRLPTRLTPGWTNRLFVLWNPQDESAPYALIFNPRRWTPLPPVPVPRFRGWRYLESAPRPAPRRPTLTMPPIRPDTKP